MSASFAATFSWSTADRPAAHPQPACDLAARHPSAVNSFTRRNRSARPGRRYSVGVSGFAAAVDTREKKEDGRKDELRTAILCVLPTDGVGMTRDEIWAKLPDAVRKNEVRFRSVMEAECGTLWRKEGKGRNGGAFPYWRLEHVTHPGEEEGGEG